MPIQSHRRCHLFAQVQQHFGEREPPLRLRLEDASQAGAEYHGEPRLGAVARAAQAGAQTHPPRLTADTLLNAASQNVQTVQTVRKRENGNRSSLEEIAVGDIFESDLSTESALEHQVVTMFMGTDMSKHFDLLTKFKLRIEAEQFDLGTQEDRTMLCCAVVHAADLSNVCRP